MAKLILAGALGLAVATSALAADIAGGWEGVWVKAGDALPVTVSFAKTAAGYSGSFDSDALQVAGIPFQQVSVTDDKVHIELIGDQTTSEFDGTVSGDRIEGTFVESGQKGTFLLHRAALPQAALESREVNFDDGDVKLAGTLLLLAGAGKHPAILFLQGSGPEGRWANRWLAQKFAAAGFVALIYDKRGVGESTGDWRKADFTALADDAVAGIRRLQSTPEVDPKQIGIYGHSQGGTIAPLVAVKAQNLAFVIASAASGLSPADVEAYSVGNSIRISALPPAEQPAARAYVQALINVAYRGKSSAELNALAAKDKDRSWYFDPPPPDNYYWAFSRMIADYNPPLWWKQVKAPVLLLYGAHDERVPPDSSARAIRTALKAGHNQKVTLKVFPDADHTFTVVPSAKSGSWPQRELSYAATLTDWARAQLAH